MIPDVKSTSSRKCNVQQNCKVYTAYIRVNKIWKKVGAYHTLCGNFSRTTASMGQKEHGLSDEIRHLKNLSTRLQEITMIDDTALETLCSSFMRN